ncbi:hypothetical protein Q3G72_010561 [Acer saccharum]|nr:hypothetical protein Q3G72_010561 [Acer saccharum]
MTSASKGRALLALKLRSGGFSPLLISDCAVNMKTSAMEHEGNEQENYRGGGAWVKINLKSIARVGRVQKSLLSRVGEFQHSIGLGDDTDAKTFGVEENKDGGLYDLINDLGTETFVTDQQEPLYQSLSPRNSTSPLPSQPMSLEVPPATRKRNRTEYEGKSSSFETNNTQLDAIDKLTHTIDKLNHAIDSIAIREHSSWDLIKEIPNLDNYARFKALKLLNTRVKKTEFSKMTPEEHSEWIFYELTQNE